MVDVKTNPTACLIYEALYSRNMRFLFDSGHFGDVTRLQQKLVGSIGSKILSMVFCFVICISKYHSFVSPQHLKVYKILQISIL